MVDEKVKVMAVVGSLKQQSVTRAVLSHMAGKLKQDGCEVDFLDLGTERLALFNPDSTKKEPDYSGLQTRVHSADVFILGSPDYHGSISGAMKNFLDYFWGEFAGKLFVPVVASHEKGLTVIDQLRTIARQCYAWILPYGISAAEKADVLDGNIVSKTLADRLDMVIRDTRIYGTLLARQRRADLACHDCSYLAKYRKK